MSDPSLCTPSSAPNGPPAVRRKFVSRQDLMTLTKARLSFMVVVTTFIGYWLGVGWDGLGWRLIHAIFGTTLTAFGAAVFNQLIEISPDAKMHRTADRPLPGGRIPVEMAFLLGWILSAVGIMHLGIKVNVESAALAALTLVIYVFVYTPMKLRSTWNTLVGAVSGALPPVIGWVAARGGGAFVAEGQRPEFLWEIMVQPQAIFLFALLFLWQLPHFLAINWIYREEYIRGGFVMYANEDAEGTRTSRMALGYSVALALLPLHATWAGFAHPAFAAIGIALGVGLVWLAWRFCGQRDRTSARKLFFATLIYLPIILTALCLLRKT